jgi:hypothetical protein
LTAVEQLDDDALLELVRRTDDLRVVSAHANARRGEDPNLEGRAIDLRNRYREPQRGPSTRASATVAGGLAAPPWPSADVQSRRSSGIRNDGERV